MKQTVVQTELLIVGAGPAGGALACFLASHGRTGILIAAAPGTANTPRAHITNMAALECLRDIGLEEECTAIAAHSDNMAHTRWCYSMAGEEYARIHSWGNDPHRKGDYEKASPCNHIDLPQTALEPILIRRAVNAGWKIRFNASLISLDRPSPDSFLSYVRDDLTGSTYKIQSRYLFGCDGARSQVVRELQLPLIRKPGQGLALNILVQADLSHLMEHRQGNLHWVLQPDKEYPPWGWAAIVRMVKPWTEWMFIFLPVPGADVTVDDMNATNEEYMVKIRDVIGDDSVEAKILDVSKWWINEIVAEKYSDGNAFCLGDAVHRHPPFNGLGSNTCIQDAFNLAWKVSYVMSGKAGSNLLNSFSQERQPVGVDLITRANQGLRDHSGWMEPIGMLEPDVLKRRGILIEFEDQSSQGRQRRRQFQTGIASTKYEFHGLGAEMNQTYTSTGIYLADETGPLPPLEHDPILTYRISTYPGKRLPHTWVNSRIPGKKLSTIDVAGHGRFCLLTGPGGHAWKDAANQVAKDLGVEIESYSIGWKQDYEDVYFEWADKREVEEDGCVLVRPDRFVAWRSQTLVEDCTQKLGVIMRSILGLN